MRTVYGDHRRFVDTYFSTFPGKYFSGDGCRRDEDGYYWITGRVDDIINVSGHRLGTAEIESALVEHDKVAEAAVVAYPHDIKGQGIYAYVTLMESTVGDDAIKQELFELVRRQIGAIAIPDIIQWAPNLPKTRSGKIMRRILRKIASDDTDNLGDISTLADPSSIKEIIAEKAANGGRLMVFPKTFEEVMMKRFITPTLFVLIMLISGIVNAAETVRVGTLQFGTVNWELDTARHYGLDTEQNIRIEVMSYANKQAVHIIFQSEEVDMIVTDWVWVSRKRAEGDDFSFIPYSSSLGAVMMPPDSNIESLSDLRDLRLGVAGGAHDKSWLLLQAWGNKEHNFKLSDSVDVNYAAPPLLNGQIERNNLDAVLNFWHYCARLEAINYHPSSENVRCNEGFGRRSRYRW